MEKMPKIALLRWDADQISDVLMKLETLPGNSTIPLMLRWYTLRVQTWTQLKSILARRCWMSISEYVKNWPLRV